VSARGQDAVSPARYVIMGVAGSGKTLIGSRLSAALGFPFLEGDDLHPAENKARMAAGIPLTDADRAGWLATIATRIIEARAAGRGLVVSCSALKRSYRDVLRAADPDLRFIHLSGPRALIAERLATRTGHFMPPSMLDSQLATLEQPTDDERVAVHDISGTPESIVDAIVAQAT
jgi:gluconokinase